ncbi:MAG TPA: HEAT repeat domain-containing protein [Planctomycetota bacterium]|jgi:HEAT repeat protein
MKLHHPILACLLFAAALSFAGEEEQKLIELLKGTDQALPVLSQKDQACRKLAVIGTKDCVPVLISLLGDEKMCEPARFALAAIPDASADEALKDQLGKQKGRQLMGVITTIGDRRKPDGIAAISKFITDADPDTARMAAQAVAQIGGPEAGKALQGALGSAPAATKGIVAIGCLRCADSLLASGKTEDAVAIYEKLRAGDLPKYIQAGGLRGIVLAKGPAGASLVIENLKSPDKEFFRMAFRLARELPGAEVSKALGDALASLPEDRQLLLIQAIGDRKDPAGLPAVLQMAKAGPQAARVLALKTLAQFGDGSVIPVLFDALSVKEPQQDILKAAQFALAGLPDTQPINDAIMAMAEKGDTKMRLLAIDIVGDRRIASATPVLLKCMEDPDEQIRSLAVRILGESSGMNGLEALLPKLLKPKSAQDIGPVETAISAICGRLTEKQPAADKLVAALGQAEGPSKCALLKLLRVTGGANALTAVRAATKDADAQTKDAAMRSLFEWPALDAAPDLLEIAKNPPTPVYGTLALRGYVRISGLKDVPAEKKPAMCKEAMALANTPDLKKSVLAGLGEVAHPQALALIEGCLGDAAVKAETEQALMKCARLLAESNPAEVRAALTKLISTSGSVKTKSDAERLLRQLKKR